jgi:uncharacterized protein YcaQ
MRLSLEDARTVLLEAQGILEQPRKVPDKAAVLEAIRRMGALQIDTIHVVARSPYLVLWSRLGEYEARWLDELLAEGALFEYWSHAACYLPIEDYALYRREMLEGRPRARAWMTQHADVVEKVRERVREHGEARSAHFERTDGRAGTWWDWKPEKLALECLLSTGEIMIARRDTNFHRVYDLRERVLPQWDDARIPGSGESRRRFALKAVKALGVAKASSVPDYFRTSKPGSGALLEELSAEGKLTRAEVEGWDEPAYMHPDLVPRAKRIAGGQLRAQRTTFLSPFDPIIWDRSRVKALFGFDYRIETYTPEAKRRYGYFTLPILHRNSLVGRLDAKAYRKEGRFSVKALHLEPGVAPSQDLIAGIVGALRDCATWHHTPEVEILRSDPVELAAAVREELRTGEGVAR